MLFKHGLIWRMVFQPIHGRRRVPVTTSADIEVVRAGQSIQDLPELAWLEW